MTPVDSKDINYKIPFTVAVFQATWDYLPQSLLNSFLYLPFHPFTRIRNLRNLYVEYGKQILREQRSEIDLEKPEQKKRKRN